MAETTGVISLANSEAGGDGYALLDYEWTVDEPGSDVREALARADELARRIDQQILRIDPDGRLMKYLAGEEPTQAGPSSKVSAILQSIYDRHFSGRRSNELTLRYLKVASKHLRHYIHLYLEKSAEPKLLLRALKGLEAQLVNVGLRYRIQVLMKRALLAVAIAVLGYCFLWLFFAVNDYRCGEYRLCATVNESVFLVKSAFPNMKIFSIFAIGLFSGRFLYIFMSQPTARDTFENYYLIERQLDTPVTDICADNFIAFCATILFVSGIVVIGVGAESLPLPDSSTAAEALTGGEASTVSGDATEKSNAGRKNRAISTLNLSNPEIAIGFGILTGLARQQFLNRIRRVAENTVSG
tara:strand:+ start:542 stop:1609 length:1068 start_codon:yes stop_codon:yes gene_type:complete